MQYVMLAGPTIDAHERPRNHPNVNWISIDERWPPGSVHVLVLLRSGCYAVLNRFKNEWWPGGIPCEDAIAWVHLPKPPRMTLAPVRPAARTKKKRRGKRKARAGGKA
jgi:hypothetical protein